MRMRQLEIKAPRGRTLKSVTRYAKKVALADSLSMWFLDNKIRRGSRQGGCPPAFGNPISITGCASETSCRHSRLGASHSAAAGNASQKSSLSFYWLSSSWSGWFPDPANCRRW